MTAQIVEFQRAQLDALHSLSRVMFDAASKMSKLDLATLRQSAQRTAATTDQVIGARDASELLTLSRTLVQQEHAGAFGYSHSLFDVLRRAREQAMQILQTHLDNALNLTAAEREMQFERGPAGVASVGSLMQNAVAASANACDRLIDSARRAMDTSPAIAVPAVETISATTAGASAKARSRKAA